MPLSNQIYGKIQRVIPSPDNEHELYVVIHKSKPMPIDIIKRLDATWSGIDTILTLTKLNKKVT